MKITISGDVGSGKSTISKLLSQKLNLKYYSIGSFMREIARNRNLTIMELSQRAESDPTIDAELDDRQKNLSKEDKFIMDSRLGFHFIPKSYKIFLTVDINEAAKRIMNDNRAEEKYSNISEAVKHLNRRSKSENMRYKEYYNIDFPNKDNFDLIIDTTNKTPEIGVKEIVKKINPKHK